MPHTRTGWDERVNGEGTIVRGTRAKKRDKKQRKRNKEKEEKRDGVGRRYRKLQGAGPRPQQEGRRYNRRIVHEKV